MSTSRKPARQPGKKSGARINQTLALKPLNAKTATKYELDAHAALVALQHDCAKQDHLVSLYVLADLSERIGGEAHIKQHAASIKRMCEQIHNHSYECGGLTYHAMRASTDVLLSFILTQRNAVIAKVALSARSSRYE